MRIILNVRSGIVTGVIEAMFLLIFSPILSRATARVYNYMTTRILLAGTSVPICDYSTSVEDFIPRLSQAIRSLYQPHVKRVGIWRSFVTLFISLVLTTGMFLLGVFTDGSSVPLYRPSTVQVWNGGGVVDTLSPSLSFGKARDIPLISRNSAVCADQYSSNSFFFHAIGYDASASDGNFTLQRGICMDGIHTKQTIGINVTVGDITFNPSSEPVRKQDMQGVPASFTFVRNITRTNAPDYCRVDIVSKGTKQRWTFSNEDSTRARFATRATRKSNGEIVLQAGVVYHYADSFETINIETRDDCSKLSADRFADNRLRAEIKPVGVQINLRHLELVTADMLMQHVRSGYARVEIREIMWRMYYAGTQSGGNGEMMGGFSSQIIDVLAGMRSITVISERAVVGLGLTLFGTLVLVVGCVPLKPLVRITSPAYVSAIYRANRQDDARAMWDGRSDSLRVLLCDGAWHVKPVVDDGGNERRFRHC